ncbi:MAG: PEP-CTERM sorting domain-containing protein [Gemmatales bacterium]
MSQSSHWKILFTWAALLGSAVAVPAQSPATNVFDYSSQPGYDITTGTGTLSGTSHYISSGTNGFNGIDVNSYLGANTFYTAGFTGTSARIMNIEAGVGAGGGLGLGGANSPGYTGGHFSLAHVNTYVASNSNPFNDQTLADRHATWVMHAMGGRDNGLGAPLITQGIGLNSQMSSAGIANAWSGAAYRLGFNFSYSTFIEPYRAATLNDIAIRVNGANVAGLANRQDVTNSSWGFTDPTGSAFSNFSRGVDALARQATIPMVFSAGNSGLGDGTVAGSRVGGPAAGYNVISVGALTGDQANPAFNTIASFSSRGPMPVFVPLISNVTDINNASQGTIINSARGRVDISAPGDQLTLAYYGGTTGGNQSPSQGGTPNGGNNFFTFNTAGTSFAAPTVAGGLSLLVDAGRTQLGGANNALDGRVLKAVLLNSATKTAGWSNAATGAGTVASPYSTTQGLDYNVGAGRMNLNQAFTQYLSGTTGVANPTGGIVSPVGWAMGGVSSSSVNSDYLISSALQAGSTFTATLSWYVNRSIDAASSTLEQRFDDLNLEVYLLAGQNQPISTGQLVASSTSVYDVVEHVNFTLPQDGFYGVRVLWEGTNWNFTGTDGESFGVAWAGVTAVPEPVTVAFLGLTAGVAGFYIVRRRKQMQAMLDQRVS